MASKWRKLFGNKQYLFGYAGLTILLRRKTTIEIQHKAIQRAQRKLIQQYPPQERQSFGNTTQMARADKKEQ